MYKHMAFLAILSSGMLFAGNAMAGDATVECISQDYKYNECYAPLNAPQLVYQSSHSACIVNRTWGFNPGSRRIWVKDGCAGVFSDAGGYHHGQGGTFDPGARQYDSRGRDSGAVVAGALLGALIEGAATSGKKHTTTNNYLYTGKTGSGYTGCHGIGCLVDDPDTSSSSRSYDAPPEPGQSSFSDNSPPEPGQAEMSGGSDDDDN